MLIILGAMEEEIGQLLTMADLRTSDSWGPFSLHFGKISNQEVCIVKCGVGKVLSAMLTQHLIDRYKPSAVVFSGLAGSLNPKFEIGDIMLSVDCIQHDMDAKAIGFKRGQVPYTDIFAVKSDQRLLNVVQQFKPDNFKIHVGRLLTGDQFITKSDDRSHQYMTSELHGDAVDMEGASVATVCSINKIPFLIIRTISDKADGTSPENFQSFLPVASKHAAQVVAHLVKLI